MAGISSVSPEALRMYHAVATAVGRETADRLYPHIARYLARLDTGVKNTSGFDHKDE